MNNTPVSPLSSAEKKKLRGNAQRLKPHVFLGKQGLSQTVLAEIDTALLKNGLIKVRFETKHTEAQEQTAEIATKLNCEYAGGVGKVGIFFREMPKEESVRKHHLQTLTDSNEKLTHV